GDKRAQTNSHKHGSLLALAPIGNRLIIRVLLCPLLSFLRLCVFTSGSVQPQRLTNVLDSSLNASLQVLIVHLLKLGVPCISTSRLPALPIGLQHCAIISHIAEIYTLLAAVSSRFVHTLLHLLVSRGRN